MEISEEQIIYKATFGNNSYYDIMIPSKNKVSCKFVE